MSASLLSAQNLTCIREDRILFDDLSFDIYPGDIVQIEGPNGAGKTSLLRILAGLSQPYEGSVRYQESSIKADSEAYHQALLYLGHTPGVKGELSAEENLNFNLSLHNLSNNYAQASLDKVNLLGFEDSLASHLSAGQHRRIALARLYAALNAKQNNDSNGANANAIWILDEPFTAIDKQGVADLEQLFIAHTNQGGCVILTTHQDLSICADKVKKITLEYQF